MLRNKRQTQRVARTGVAVALLSGACVLIAAAPAAARPVPWTAAVVTAAADGAEAVITADIDGDGNLDLVSASRDDNTIAWYENNGDGTWGATTTVISGIFGPTDVAAADFDGDGDLDLVSAATDSSTIAVHRNDGTPFGPNWESVTVGATAAGGASGVTAADIDGDGDTDLAAASEHDNTIAWYENGGDPFHPFVPWAKTVVTATAAGAREVTAADIDGDGDLDLAAASFYAHDVAWYQNNGSPLDPSWTETIVADDQLGVYSVVAADIDGDGDTDLAAASYHDHDVAWYQNNGSPLDQLWTATIVTADAGGATGVTAADIDGDGDTDLASTSGDDHVVAWHENNGTPLGSTWSTTVVGGAGGAQDVVAADIDGDGDTDLASASADDDTIAWYRNDTIHRSATAWTHAALPPSTTYGNGTVATGDLDGDGDLDLATAAYGDGLYLYENDTAGGGSTWTVTDIGLPGAVSVAVGDLDSDGDLDLAAASWDDALITWYENDGTGGFTVQTSISSAATQVMSVVIADIDGDSHLDIVAASTGHGINWYGNDRDPNPTFLPTPIEPPDPGSYPTDVAVGDFDGDGALDVVSTAIDFVTVHLDTALEDDGASWASTDISTSPEVVEASDVSVGDIDGDGDLDLAVAAWPSGLFWFENTDGTGSVWAQIGITGTTINPHTVAMGDLDGDGDLDLATADPNQGRVDWYENDGVAQPGFTRFDVDRTADADVLVAFGDFDRDGDLDLATAGDGGAWYRNDGGQVGLAASATAPGTFASHTEDDVLQVTVTHQGRAGDHAAELVGFGLRLEEDAGDPLSDDEAEALIQELRLHRDDGDGIFDPADDTLVASDSALNVNGDGDLELVLDEVGAAVTFGSPAQFHVVVQLTRNADGQTPDSFRISFLPSQTYFVDDTFDVVVTTAAAADVAATTTAVNTAPVADAGGPYAITVGEDVELDATGTTDVQQNTDDLGYAWDLDDDGDFDDSTDLAPTFTGTTVGTHDVHVEVTDARGDTGTDTATITVAAAPLPTGPGGPAPTTTTTLATTTTTTPAAPADRPPTPAPSAGGASPMFLGPDGEPVAVPLPLGLPGTPAAAIAVSPTESIAVLPDGRVLTTTPGHQFGSISTPLNAPVVGLGVHWIRPGGALRAVATDGDRWIPGGYWLVSSDGGVFSYGTARFHGSLGDQPLNAPIVGVSPTATGNGYWLAATDGGVFTFGDGRFHGSMGATPLNAPVTAITATSTGRGYWLIASDGGIFTFGDAIFHGSGSALRRAFNGLVPAPDGTYWLVTREGTTVRFG